MKELIDNTCYIREIEDKHEYIRQMLQTDVIAEAFYNDFAYRLCWSSNAIEGNTLSLDETVAVIAYDEVRAGHTYNEYTEAKNHYIAISKQLMPLAKRTIDERWIQMVNGYVLGRDGAYRNRDVYIGNMFEATYYPPAPGRIRDLMAGYVADANQKIENTKELFTYLAGKHIAFERIHPFIDGNGRTGRILLSQQLYNNDMLPLAVEQSSDYRQAFRRYDKTGDSSKMVQVLCKSELESYHRVEALYERYRNRNQ